MEDKKLSQKKKHNFKLAKDYVFNFIKDIIDTHGPRLPGSKEEQEAATSIEKYMSEATGKKVIRENFKVSPVASIGAIPVLGVLGFIILALYYISIFDVIPNIVGPILTITIGTFAFLYAIIQIFMYKGWFDFLWRRHTSQNVYSVIDGGDKIDYTIVFSGHMDSSWNWNLSNKNPMLMIPKTGIFLGSVFALIVISIFAIINKDAPDGSVTRYLLDFLPLLAIPGCYWGSRYLTWNKKKASPGAMDNLTGVGISLYMGKYFKENPDKLPKNCRIIIAALGSEEAGLKGSMDFVKKHKDDGLLINPICLNIDSISDYDYFGVVSGDIWQRTNFDKGLIDIAFESFQSLGLKTQSFKNPVGGCDSTPFCKAGYRTVTLCAQNPVPTTYYHTYNDTYDRLDQRSLEKGVEGIIKITEKVMEEQK